MQENFKQLKTTFVTNLDLKSILIIILFIISGVFFTKYMLEGNSNRKERIELEKKNQQLEKEKRKLEKKYEDLTIKFEIDSIQLLKLQSDYEKINEELNLVNSNLEKKKVELKNYIKKLEETKRKIQDFEKNPPNRTGNDLIESIKQKTN